MSLNPKGHALHSQQKRQSRGLLWKVIYTRVLQGVDPSIDSKLTPCKSEAVVPGDAGIPAQGGSQGVGPLRKALECVFPGNARREVAPRGILKRTL